MTQASIGEPKRGKCPSGGNCYCTGACFQNMEDETQPFTINQWQTCPMCGGAYVTCRACNSTGIININTGKPPH